MSTKNKQAKSLKILNWNNYQPSSGEINSGEVVTIPDQSYTVEQIFDKFTRGISLPLVRNITYTLDDESEDFEAVDLRSTIQDPYDLTSEDVEGYNKRRKAVDPDGLPSKESGPKIVPMNEEGVKDGEKA